MPPPPANAYQSGTKLTVGSHKVTITKYISQGGFAHVYTCTIDPPFRGSNIACLKRVAVPSKWQLNLLRQEVDAMKRLRGNPTIVSYIDSHASRLYDNDNNNSVGNSDTSKQQYEVFLLMEYCANNGLIDFMNTRLTNKLTEPEILVIMKDITLAVAMCHHLQPPLLHRDIKIENVLLDEHRTYKLCDFGSAVPYAAVPKNPQEFNALFEDIMQHTTPQYRAPEMIELSRGFPIDDKLDIWALGCFLYKLCYYTTPFELSRHTSLQDLEHLILHCSQTLRIPHNSPGSTFTPRLKNIIKCCLREDPRRRPNAVQLLEEICLLMNVPVPNYIPASVLERPTGQPTTQPSVANNLLKPLQQSLHNQNSQSTPQLPVRKISHNKPADPFASIDKSKLLNGNHVTTKPSVPLISSSSVNNLNHTDNFHTKNDNSYGSNRPKSTYGSLMPRPKSIYETSRNILPVPSNEPSSNSLKDYILQQLSKSSENVSMVKNNDDKDNTLNFLRDKEDEYKLGVSSKQDTGGSFNKFKNGLRRISTGNSSTGVRSSNNTGNNYIPNKRSSISSIKQLLTGGSARKVSNSEEDLPPKVNQSNVNSNNSEIQIPKKLSIQRRMAQYLTSNDDNSYKKTALGYGKYTKEFDVSDTEDIQAINDHNYKRKSLLPPKVPESLSSKRSNTPPLTIGTDIKTNSGSKTSSIPKKTVAKSYTAPLTKKPPPKPKKPIYLRSPETDDSNERRLSNSSEIELPDLDDLEKQFAKRFPSYV